MKNGTTNNSQMYFFSLRQRNLSVKSLQDKLENSSLTTQKLLVVSKYEDPEVLKERQKTVQSKSVSELAQISTLSDLPVPSRIEKLLPYSQKSSTLKRSKSGDNIAKPKDYSHLSPMAIHDTIYSTLPRSMKSELKVRVRCESPGVMIVQFILLIYEFMPKIHMLLLLYVNYVSKSENQKLILGLEALGVGSGNEH